MSWITKPELTLAAKLLVGALYALAIYLAPQVLEAAFTVFDYGRF